LTSASTEVFPLGRAEPAGKLRILAEFIT
jgi:hypothetical protein